MKIAAMIVGLIGSIIGLFSACSAGAIGTMGRAFEAEGSATVQNLAWFAFVVVLVGLVGAALAIAKPKLAGIMMIGAGLVGFIAISALWIPSGVMLLIAGVLALLAAKGGKSIEMPPPAPPAP